jgi:putative oxidoreductase
MTTTNALPRASGTSRLITLWILSGLVCLAFIGAGGAKFAGVPAMVEVFERVGIGQWFRYFTGALEVAAGIGLLIPRYAFYAAVLLAIVMVGAIAAHLTVLGSSPAARLCCLFLLGRSCGYEGPDNDAQLARGWPKRVRKRTTTGREACRTLR